MVEALEEWDSQLYFEGNFAHEAGDDIFTSSLIPCIRSGSNGSTDTSVDARKKVFRATPPFHYSGNLTSNSIVTSATEIKFRVIVSNDDLHISVYPGQLFNLTTKVRSLDELGAPSLVPFFTTTNVSNNGLPAAVVDSNSVYTTGYLQFDANNKVEQRHSNVNTTVQMQTISEPALLFSFNVTMSECLPESYITFPNKGVSGQCACAHNSEVNGYLEGIVCYEHNGGISIYRQASVWYGKVPSKSHSADISVTAPYPFCYRTNSVNNLVPLNQTVPTSGICRGTSHGILCGTCDHGMIITSHTFECCTLEEKQAISDPAAWASWITIQIFLTTVVVIVIFVFDFDVTRATLCSFVFFSQVVLDLNMKDCTSGQLHEVIGWNERFYAFWSLRFRWLLSWIMRFCLPFINNNLDALPLDYIFALYPFGLIVFVWAIAYCQAKEWRCKCCRIVCLKFNKLFNWFRERTSLVHGIATCLILTYGDLVSVSFFLLTPVQLQVQHGTNDANDIEGGSWRSLYHGDDLAYFGYPHYLYGTGAIIAVVLLGFLPPLFLMSYPWLPQLLRKKCSKRLGDKVEGWYQKRVVHHFLDLFQGQFKDNHRYFAGMWLVYRLILHANDAFTPDCRTSFAIQISFSIVFLLLHSILQPNRKTKYHILDSLFFADIALLSTLGLVFWSSNGQDSDTNAITAFLAIFLALPHLYFFCVVIYRIANWIYGRPCCRGQDAGERQPLLNVATDAVKSIASRRMSSSVIQSNNGDGDEANIQGIKVSEAVVCMYQSDHD